MRTAALIIGTAVLSASATVWSIMFMWRDGKDMLDEPGSVLLLTLLAVVPALLGTLIVAIAILWLAKLTVRLWRSLQREISGTRPNA